MRSRGYSPGSTAAAASAWQTEVRADLFVALRLSDLVNGPGISLREHVVSSETGAGYSRSEITFASTPTRRINAVVTLPDGDGVVPAVVCIHGHGGDRFVVFDSASIYKGFAQKLAGSGYATIAIDVGQHEVYEQGRLLMGERLWDCIRAIDWLAAHPRIDSSRIGCAGLSLGGEMAMWLGAMDTRVCAELSAGFLTTMDQMEHNHCLCWKFDGLRELVDYADIYALTAPRALQCQNGLQETETQFHVPLARRALLQIGPAYSDLGAAGCLSLHIHNGGHEIDLPALELFFQRHL
jgi:esterase/lipase